MSNSKETGPSDQDADEMDYEGEQEYLDYLTAKKMQSQSLQVIRLQRIYNFLLFHAILYCVLDIIGLYYTLLYYYWD